MLSALLSFLGGSAFRAIWGEISQAWTKYQEHRHELALLEIQARMDADRHSRNLEAIRVQAELGVKTIEVQAEADAWRGEVEAFARGVELTGKSSGVRWVDAWNGCIRPALATLCMLLWALHVWRSGGVLDDQGWALLGAALGIYVADRTLAKRGK